MFWNMKAQLKRGREHCRLLPDFFFSLSLFPFLFQRAHLLDNTERLERSSRRLEAGYQIAVETGKNSESEQIVLLMHSSLHNT